jgi:hypothetical protein
MVLNTVRKHVGVKFKLSTDGKTHQAWVANSAHGRMKAADLRQRLADIIPSFYQYV